MDEAATGQRDGGRLVLADRVHRYRAPVEFYFDALTTGRQEWLALDPGEVLPTIVESEPGRRVVWSSMWPVSPDDTIEFDLWREDDPAEARTAIRFRWFSNRPPDERGIAITRQRLNRKLGGTLRGADAEYGWHYGTRRYPPEHT